MYFIDKEQNHDARLAELDEKLDKIMVAKNQNQKQQQKLIRLSLPLSGKAHLKAMKK